jgi:hypothetical protein
MFLPQPRSYGNHNVQLEILKIQVQASVATLTEVRHDISSMHYFHWLLICIVRLFGFTLITYENSSQLHVQASFPPKVKQMIRCVQLPQKIKPYLIETIGSKRNQAKTSISKCNEFSF